MSPWRAAREWVRIASDFLRDACDRNRAAMIASCNRRSADRSQTALTLLRLSPLEQGRDIPDFDGGIPAAGRQPLPVARDGESQDVFATVAVFSFAEPMRLDLAELLAGRHFPAANDAVLSTGRHGLAVGEEGDAIDETAMPFEHLKRLARADIPDAGHVVAARRGQQFAVRGKR